MTHQEIINKFGTRSHGVRVSAITRMADELDVTKKTIEGWYRRDKIPAEWWNCVVAEAKCCGIKGVSLQALADGAEDRG